MLLFKPEHVPLILNGTKTQTRRNWVYKKGPKKGQLRDKPRVKVGAIHLAKTQMLSTDYFAKLKILRVWREKLGDISREDAIAEGYLDGNDYLRAYFTINKIKKIEWPSKCSSDTKTSTVRFCRADKSNLGRANLPS